jgi:putative ABC transport system permease protein
MTWLHRLASILTWSFNRDRAEQQLDSELQTFVDMSAAEKVRDGIAPAEARRLARLELGGIEQAKERVRTARHGASLDEVGRDVRYALRMFAAHRTFTAIVVLTLALGIGANTAIFSIVDGLLLRRLPVKDADRLAMLVAPAGAVRQMSWTYPIWEEIRQHADAFDGAFAWSRFDAQFNLTRGGETQFVDGVWASGNAFATLGIPAILGRTLTPADDRRGGGEDGPVTVISYAFWQRHFGGAPDVIGRTLLLEQTSFTIVGVTPPHFFGLNAGRAFDLAVPFGIEPLLHGVKESRLDRRTSWWLSVMVRLKPGQTLQEGTTAFRALQPQIREATRPAQVRRGRVNEYLDAPFELISAAAGQSGLRDQYQRPLIVMMTVVGLVLLIACANIANLLLARATARGHEWSVRLALGASRGRLARQQLTESLLLAVMGAAAGLLVAQWGSELLLRQLSSDAVSLDLTLDWRVLGFTAAIAIAAALVFGVVPALRATAGAPIDALKDQGRSHAATGRATVASGLVIAQVVLSVILVVGAGLFLRTFTSLINAPLGFEGDRVLLIGIDARRAALAPEGRAITYDRVLERVRAVPGAEAAGLSLIAPVSGAMWSRRVEVSGSSFVTTGPIQGPEGMGFTDSRIPESDPLAVFNAVTPGWVSAYGTQLLAGREISERDGASSAPVALVNEAFARKFLPGANPIGHTVRTTSSTNVTSSKEIVGLVADAVYRDVREPILPTVYVPWSQYDGDDTSVAPGTVVLSVRAGSSPGALTRTLAAAIAEINPTLALTFKPLADQVSETFVQERLLAWLSACFGGLALLIAAVGLYGVTSYAVSLRRQEIGIRMALGATRAVVLQLVLGRVWILTGIGIAAGLAISAWASRFVATLLYGLEPTDPITLLAAGSVLAAVGTLAGWLPAHRASRLDPTTVLRQC